MFSKQLVVLVGGRGTRLGEATKITPKPLLEINEGRAFLDYFLENAVRQGFVDILLLAGYLGEQVYERYHGKIIGAARITVLIEPEAMGTGGAFRFAYDHLQPTFMAANGDTLFDINMRAVDHRVHVDATTEGVLALRHVADSSRYGQVSLDAEGGVVRFAEKHVATKPVAGLINGGIYSLRKTAIDRLPEGASSIESDLFPLLAEEGKLGGVVSTGYFLDIGLPDTLQMARRELPERRRKVLFLDRDGVLNIDKGYLYRIEDFEWVEGAISLIRRANDIGRAVIVITNQAGVARGLYTEADVHVLHRYMQECLYENGAFVDAFYYCPYHKDASIDRYWHADHPDRKPNPGMIIKAISDHDLDIDQAVMIGDQLTDVAAAEAAGIMGLLYTGGNLNTLKLDF
ncbi:HAD-IIIA family hydrolase (plasmid) [Ensifer adhaerens]|uniref:HAD-IIIA family hydrolase n=1 Tax=Ensifer adhaerens TaxID=106592 RepID=UPI0023A95EF1|nr:HAD-IIIA family hydrolase [Ensifer adhaerens]WDZ80915.1 HAD-IIIA family hydrolase [Ensifer adhaerens]